MASPGRDSLPQQGRDLQIDQATRSSERSSESARTPTTGVERASEHAGAQDKSRDIDRKQAEIREHLHSLATDSNEESSLTTNELRTLSLVFNEKVNFLQGDIRDLRSQAQLLQRADNTQWVQVEGAANLAETRLLSLLEQLEFDTLTSAAPEVSKTLDKLISQLQHARLDRGVEPASSNELSTQLDDSLSEVFDELGIDLPLDDPKMARRLLQQHRELLSDHSTELSDVVEQKRSDLQHQLELLNEQTREHEYGLLDTFTNRYDIENTMDSRQIQHIGELSQHLQTLESQLGGLQGQLQTIDAGLEVLDAHRAASQGNDLLAARHLARLQEGPTATLLGAAQSRLASLADEATTALRERGALSEQEELLYSESDTQTRLDTAVRLFNEMEPTSAAAVDIRDQVLSRETFRVTRRGAATELFERTPRYRGALRSDFEKLEYRRLSFSGADANGESYTVLFDSEASRAWDSVPDGAQPLLIKPHDHLRVHTSRSSRRGVRTELISDPERSLVTRDDVGYVQNGRVYDADGTQLDLDTHPQRRWIEHQTRDARSFSTMHYRPPAEIRELDHGSHQRIPVKEQLYSIQTTNGERISGVRMSDEVRQLLDERPPEGMTLVLRRIPQGISLGGRQTEVHERSSSRGRKRSSTSWYGTQAPIDELRIEDLGYARIDNGKLHVESIEETRASRANADPIRLGQSQAFDPKQFFSGTIRYEGRTQAHLNHTQMRRLVFHGAAQEGREYTLAFPRSADEAWRSLPDDGQPILLRPFQTPEITVRRTGGRNPRSSTILHTKPYEFVVQPQDVGFFRDGKLYTHQQQEIPLQGHQHEAWIRGQLEHGRSLDAVPLQYRTPLLVADGSEKISETLYRLTRPDGSRIDGVQLDPEVRELLRRELPPGSSIVLKREPRALRVGKEFERNGETMRQILEAPDRISLDDVAISNSTEQGFRLSNVEPLIPQVEHRNEDELRHLERDRADEVLRVLSQDEDIAHMQSAALSTYQTLSHLQSSLEAHGAGSSREAFVDFVRSEAKPLHEFLTASDTAERLGRLESKLAQLKELRRGVADGETEQQITRQIQAIEQFVEVVKDPKIKNVLETLLDTSKFGPDNWAHWSTHELPIIAGAVAGAVAGSALVVATAGAAGVVVVPLWAAAAGMAVGTVVGMELTREGLYHYHQNFGDAASGELRYGDRSLLGTKLSGTAVFNPTSGDYEQLTWGQVTQDYSIQLATNFALSYATMLGSNVLAAQASKFFQNTLVLERIAAHSPNAQRALRYLANAQSRTLSAAEQQQLRAAFQEAFKKMPVEFLDEMGDEALEKVGEEFFSSISRRMGLSNSGRIEGSLAALLIGAAKGTRVGPSAVGYDASAQSPQEVQALLDDARSQGYIVQDLGRGYYTMLHPQNAQKVTLRPYTESELAARVPPAETDADQQSDSVSNTEPGTTTASDQRRTPLARFELREQLFQRRLQGLREQHPDDWHSRVEQELSHERTALLESAQAKFAADGVRTEVLYNDDGGLHSLVILPERGASELNTYASRMQKARGVALEYDPLLLASEQAGALYDSNAQRILLPHDVVRNGHRSQQVYHEKIHAVFDRIRSQGGDSLFFGTAELRSGTLSLDEYATYNELLLRELHGLASGTLTPDEQRQGQARVDEHLAVFSAFNSEFQEVLAGADPSALAAQMKLEHQIRIDADGTRRIHLLGTVESNGQRLALDLASSTDAGQLPSREQLQAHLQTKLERLQIISLETTNHLNKLASLLQRDAQTDSTDPDTLTQAATQARQLRVLISEHYLLPAIQTQVSDESQLVLPRIPAINQTQGNLQLQLAASHEAALGSTVDFPNLEEVLRTTEVAQQAEREARQKPFERSIRIQNAIDPFELQIHGDNLSLRFEDGTEVATTVALTSAEVEQLFRQVKASPNNFGPRLSNNLEVLASSIELARLHAAFYGSDQLPEHAAQALTTQLQNTKFPAQSIRILEGSTSQERLAAYQQFAEAGSSLAEALQPKFRDEEVNEAFAAELRAELEKQYGAKLLDEILANHEQDSTFGIEQLLDELETNAPAGHRPVLVEITGRDLSDADGQSAVYRFSIERQSDGRLSIEQLSPRLRGNSEIHSLEQLLSRLEQSTQYPGQRALWRNHARVDSAAFRPSTGANRRFRATHEEETLDQDGLLDRVVAHLEDPQNGLSSVEKARLYWDLQAADELALIDSIAPLEAAARADLLEDIALIDGMNTQELLELSQRTRHLGLTSLLPEQEQKRIDDLRRVTLLATRYKDTSDSLSEHELAELFVLATRRGATSLVSDFQGLEQTVTASVFRRIAALGNIEQDISTFEAETLLEASVALDLLDRVEASGQERLLQMTGFDDALPASAVEPEPVEPSHGEATNAATLTPTLEPERIEFGTLLGRINKQHALTEQEIQVFAEAAVLPELDAETRAEQRIPREHPQYHELQREIALQRLAGQLTEVEHKFSYEQLATLVESEVERSGLDREVVTELLYHLTRYSELGGARAEVLGLRRSSGRDRSPQRLHDVPIEGLLSLSIALGEAGLIKFGSSNKEVKLYTPNTGSTADQLAYVLNRRKLGGSGTSAGRSSHPLKNRTTEDPTNATLFLVDSTFLERMNHDKEFREAVGQSRAQFVLSPEVLGGLAMGQLNLNNAEQQLSQHLSALSEAYRSQVDSKGLQDIDHQALQSALLGSARTQLEALLPTEAHARIHTLGLNQLDETNLATLRTTQSQLNGHQARFSQQEVAETLQRALQELDIDLNAEEEALFLKALNESAVIFDTREMATLMQEMRLRIEAQAATIVENIDPKKKAEVYYVVPAKAKSYQHVAALYRNANGIESSRFIRTEDVTKLRKQLRNEGKFLVPVVLDDFSASGHSLMKVSLSATDGIPLAPKVDIRHMREYARLRREREEFPKDLKLVRQLFGPERAKPGQFPDPRRTRERPVIVAPIIATTRGRENFLQNPLSNNSAFIEGREATNVQRTEAWEALMALESMTPDRRDRLVQVMNMEQPVYDSTGLVTLVQFPHGDSNTNMRWWQQHVEPTIMISPQAIREFYYGGSR